MFISLVKSAAGYANSPGTSLATASSVDELSYLLLAAQSDVVNESFKSNYERTGRKTWKTFSKNNEAVWPPYIEAALLEALELYRSTMARKRDPKILRRFPKRNHFISQHILRVTKESRTPKQVGSRLQQLRDTCTDPDVLELLTSRAFPETNEAPHGPRQDSPRALTSENVLPRTDSHSFSYKRPHVPAVEKPWSNFQIKPISVQQGGLPVFSGANSSVSSPGVPRQSFQIKCSQGWYTNQVTLVQYEESLKQMQLQVEIPGDLLEVVPSITYTSPIPLSPRTHRSFCSPFVNNAIAYPEATELVELPTLPKENSQYIYATQLIPQQWVFLIRTAGEFLFLFRERPHADVCGHPDISTITIIQDYICVLPENGTPDDVTNFSVLYQFRKSRDVSEVKCAPETSFPLPGPHRRSSFYDADCRRGYSSFFVHV